MRTVLPTLAFASLLALAGPAQAKAGYFYRFSEYWGNTLKQTSGIGLLVIGVGVVALFIITRAKWRK
jgi:hypothetical protein